MKYPPCHDNCQDKACPAENHPAYKSWEVWAKKSSAGLSLNRFVFTRSSRGQAFRSGWDAGYKHAKKIVNGGEEWKLIDNDQA